MKAEVRQRCRELYDSVGLTVDVLVKEMRRKESPLYAEVEWDKNKAFDLYLKDRARQIIRAFYVSLVDKQKEEVLRVREYHSLPQSLDGPSKTRQYFHIEDIQQQPALMDSMLREALGELNTFRKKYRDLLQLAEVFDAIEKAEDAILKNRTAEQPAA